MNKTTILLLVSILLFAACQNQHKQEGGANNVFNTEETTVKLYNITTDPGEENNIAGANPDIVKELSELMRSARTESEVFPFR